MKKQNKNNFVSRLLLVVIILSLGTATYLIYDYKRDIDTQYENASNSLKVADKLINKKKDIRKENPIIGDVIGKVRIEGLTEDMPIISGDDINLSLAYGVGHISETPLPGTFTGQPVLSAHRETFFKPLKNAKPGDVVVVTMPYGTFKYKITHSIITGTTEDDAKKIYSTEGINKERIALITCYPFEPWTNPAKRMTFFADLIQ